MDSASASLPRRADYTNPAVEALVIVLTIAPFILLAALYNELPDPLPVHFNARFEPDGWAAKSFRSVFAVPLIGLYLQGLFLLIKGGLVQGSAAFPVTAGDPWSQTKAEQLRANVALIDSIRVIEAVLLAALVGGMVATAIPRFRPYGQLAAIAATVAAVSLVVALVYWIVKLVGLKRKIAALPAPASAAADRDESNWRGGGLFYYNPNDPALFVEKRIGVGYTFNFANRRAWLYLVYIIGLPILIFWVIGGL
jgi:uncharacterized membrane protein